MRPLLPKSSKSSSGNDNVSGVAFLHKVLGQGSQQSEFRIPAIPGSLDSGSGVGNQGGAKDKAKRIVVSNACAPWRKRRSKVMARRNSVTNSVMALILAQNVQASTAQETAILMPKMTIDGRVLENETLKRKNTDLNEELNLKDAHLDVVFRSLANADDAELENTVKRIRRGEHFEDIANEIRSAVTKSGSSAGSAARSGNYQEGSSYSNDEGFEEPDSRTERSDDQPLQGP
ncbi:hypothetical protein EV426DRAFT_668318 [Tirmania nivea]|nr:hypothetical protein EV426DRAFT_668318 [Tirmania nivea]